MLRFLSSVRAFPEKKWTGDDMWITLGPSGCLAGLKINLFLLSVARMRKGVAQRTNEVATMPAEPVQQLDECSLRSPSQPDSHPFPENDIGGRKGEQTKVFEQEAVTGFASKGVGTNVYVHRQQRTMTRDITNEGCEESTEGPAKREYQRSADLVVDNVKSPASSLDITENAHGRDESSAATSSASSRHTNESILPRESADSVVQQDLSPLLLDTDAALLTRFDLDSRYGPASGISRLERWERALRFGLSPPTSIREKLLRLAESEGHVVEQNR